MVAATAILVKAIYDLVGGYFWGEIVENYLENPETEYCYFCFIF